MTSSTSAVSFGPQRRSLFRPCVDLHNGVVKQIVGGTLEHQESEAELEGKKDSDDGGLKTNFVSELPPAHYSALYRTHSLLGGHVIKLGPNNDVAAREALLTWPGGLQVGGGINETNAQEWLAAGASKVIVTSYLFPSASFSLSRLQNLAKLVGKERLVVDVSCRKRKGGWWVAMDKWTRITDLEVTKETLDTLSEYCSELLVHAADVEGLCQGIDEELVTRLGEWTSLPCTYAGGAKALEDLELVSRLSNGKVDLTYGSALDIFGGSLVSFDALVDLSKGSAAWNEQNGFAL